MMHRATPTKQSVGGAFVDEHGEDIPTKFKKDFASADWSTRYEAITKFQDLCESRTADVARTAVVFATALTPCLNDTNSKVPSMHAD